VYAQPNLHTGKHRLQLITASIFQVLLPVDQVNLHDQNTKISFLNI